MQNLSFSLYLSWYFLILYIPKIKGSSKYNKQKLKVAKLYKKITNSRLDNLHKVSTELVRKYDVIYLEDLNIKSRTCPCCNTDLDRDLNASKNILKEGIKTLSSGTDDYRHGAQIRPVSTGTSVEVFKKKELMSPETR